MKITIYDVYSKSGKWLGCVSADSRETALTKAKIAYTDAHKASEQGITYNLK